MTLTQAAQPNPRPLAGLTEARRAGASPEDLQVVLTDALTLVAHRRTHNVRSMVLGLRIDHRCQAPSPTGPHADRAAQLLRWNGQANAAGQPRGGERGLIEWGMLRYARLLVCGVHGEAARRHATRIHVIESNPEYLFDYGPHPYYLDWDELPVSMKTKGYVAVHAKTAHQRAEQRISAVGISVRDRVWMYHDGNFVVTREEAEANDWAVCRSVTPSNDGVETDRAIAIALRNEG